MWIFLCYDTNYINCIGLPFIANMKVSIEPVTSFFMAEFSSPRVNCKKDD